jgi:hypothetical protein
LLEVHHESNCQCGDGAVINVYQDNHQCSLVSAKKNSLVNLTPGESKLAQDVDELLVPMTAGLFKAIECSTLYPSSLVHNTQGVGPYR